MMWWFYRNEEVTPCCKRFVRFHRFFDVDDYFIVCDSAFNENVLHHAKTAQYFKHRPSHNHFVTFAIEAIDSVVKKMVSFKHTIGISCYI